MKNYIIGFVISIVLTIVPIILLVSKAVSLQVFTVLILLFAAVQILVQLFFFMHLKKDDSLPFRNIGLVLAVVIVFIIIGGSVWVMSFNSSVQ